MYIVFSLRCLIFETSSTESQLQPLPSAQVVPQGSHRPAKELMITTRRYHLIIILLQQITIICLCGTGPIQIIFRATDTDTEIKLIEFANYNFK